MPKSRPEYLEKEEPIASDAQVGPRYVRHSRPPTRGQEDVLGRVQLVSHLGVGGGTLDKQTTHHDTLGPGEHPLAPEHLHLGVLQVGGVDTVEPGHVGVTLGHQAGPVYGALPGQVTVATGQVGTLWTQEPK